MAANEFPVNIHDRIINNGLGNYVDYDILTKSLILKNFDPQKGSQILARIGMLLINAGVPAAMPVFVNAAPSGQRPSLISFGTLTDLIDNNWNVDPAAET